MIISIRGNQRWVKEDKIVNAVMDNLLPGINSVSLSSGLFTATFEITKILEKGKSDVYKIRYTLDGEEYQQVEWTLDTVDLLYKIVDFIDGKLKEGTIIEGMILSKLCE